ncbi:hypothetical protein JHK82_019847 [Glycine max]|nr:hypothetical protein JHK87_019730 [Glycine soja]KAG5023957.1 hypothetical protein JHK85_020299 [Glycine max]KAG5039030.1 hypothetical protein JHK86_019870 [Glycine max]KAG5144152.1 hypothetical protein JHK82_019847 [Glycine max]KHN03041.1 hypothetical protein glysoja_009907 [Glycine soja]
MLCVHAEWLQGSNYIVSATRVAPQSGSGVLLTLPVKAMCQLSCGGTKMLQLLINMYSL